MAAEKKEKKVVARYRIAEFNNSPLFGGLRVDRQNTELSSYTDLAYFSVMPGHCDFKAESSDKRDRDLCLKLYHNVFQVIRFIDDCKQEAMYLGNIKLDTLNISVKPRIKIDCDSHDDLAVVSLKVSVWEDYPAVGEDAYEKGYYAEVFSISANQYVEKGEDLIGGAYNASDVHPKYAHDSEVLTIMNAIWQNAFHIAKLLQKAEMRYMYLGDYV